MLPTVWTIKLQCVQRGNSSIKRDHLPNLRSITIEKSPNITCADLKYWNLDLEFGFKYNNHSKQEKMRIYLGKYSVLCIKHKNPTMLSNKKQAE